MNISATLLSGLFQAASSPFASGSSSSSGPPPEFFVIFFGILAVTFTIVLAIMIAVIWVMSSTLARVPPQFRQTEPWTAWLLLIPCFSLVYNFIFYKKCSQSLQGYFHAYGQTDVGDCGEQVGLIYSICVVASIIPYVGALAGIGSLVCLILYVVKMFELKKRLPPLA